ncbi:GGDEF domain-containing protein [Terasakiella sp. A23]|uniref:GGDEF domain-containing protein n=1 Tax=Terasakiella sp. FCG-A23 TaxID=3080561 RepID=UPI0029557394|nr:GGDEF domain-containing protein [Terasakiella sp. A23]MDV7340018.1 GGDEF domain-containing protein [Terasakiella sp. A23]
MILSRKLFNLFPFALMTGLTYWLFITPDARAYIPEAILETAPYVICLIGAGFAWFFRRGNIAIAFGLGAASYCILGGFANARLIMVGITILLPLNIWLLAFWTDRGVITSSGILKICFLAAQISALFFAGYGDGGIYAKEILMHLSYQPPFFDTPLPEPFKFISLCLFVLCLIWFAVFTLMKDNPTDPAWLTFTCSIIATLYFPEQKALFLNAGLLCLILGVVLDSYRMAFMDELTGLPGRRALISDMKKLGSTYVIAMADIDHFKKFNDTYGHDVGDQVLRMVATNLSKVTGGGKAYRYGGEEFTIVFPGRNVDHALDHLERVRERVEKASFKLRAADRPKKKPKKNAKSSGATVVRVTSSFGAAERSSSAKDPMAVMKQADQALYRAKKAGRNQVSS